MPRDKKRGKTSSKKSEKVEKKSTRKGDKKSSKSGSKKDSLRGRAKDQIKESKKKGFTAMREAKSEQNFGSNWRNFWVGKGETKPLIFLLDDLVPVRTHTVQTNLPNGKSFYPEFLCTEDDDCVLCQEAKDGNKQVRNSAASGVTLVLDVDGYESKDKEIPFVIRPMTVNPSLSSVIEFRDNKEGIYLTVYDMSKLDRGHSLDVVRDKKDNIQRFEDIEEIIEYIQDDNEQSAEMLEEALEKYGDLKTWLEEEIIPEFLNPEDAKLDNNGGGKSSKDEEDDSYNFKGKRGRRGGKDKDKGKKSDKGGKRRSRLR